MIRVSDMGPYLPTGPLERKTSESSSSSPDLRVRFGVKKRGHTSYPRRSEESENSGQANHKLTRSGDLTYHAQNRT